MTLRSRVKRLGIFLILTSLLITIIVSYSTTMPWALSIPIGFGAGLSILILTWYVTQVIRAFVHSRIIDR